VTGQHWEMPDGTDVPWKVVDLTGVLATIDEHLRRIVETEFRLMEQACEAALQTGTAGVRIIREHGRTTILIDNTVPYGTIYEENRGGDIATTMGLTPD